MNKKLFTIFSVLYIGSSGFAGTLVEGDVSIYYLNQNISGWVQDGENSSKVDTKTDLGYDNKGTVGFKLHLNNPTGIVFVPNFGIEYMKVNFDGTSTLNRSINYGGVNFNNGETIKSDLKLDHYDFTFSWTLIKKSNIKLDMGGALRLLKYDTKISFGGTVGKKQEDIWVPLFYMSVKVSPAYWFDLVFSEKVMTYSGNNFSDLDVELRFYPINSVFKPFVSIGYKSESIKLNDTKGISSALTFNQPYVGVGMSF